MIVVRGVRHAWGVYQGNPYDNIVLECEQTEPEKESHYQESNNVHLFGSRTETVKVKMQDFKSAFQGIADTPEELQLLVGQVINPLYGKGSRVVKIEIIESRKGVY